MTCSAHWSDIYVDHVRCVVPEIADMPVYIRQASELSGCPCPSSCVAITGPAMDMSFRYSLKSRGQWHGRGLAIMVSESFWTETQFVRDGVILHEVSHCLDVGLPERNDDESETMDRVWNTSQGRQWICDIGNTPILEANVFATERLYHGLGFVRAGLHLSRRSGCSPQDMRLFNADRYGNFDPVRCYTALADELRRGGHIVDILKSDPPIEFAALFEAKSG